MKIIISGLLVVFGCTCVMATIIPPEKCPDFVCETVEIHETYSNTITREDTSYYTTEIISEYIINWINITDNNKGNGYSNVIRDWNNDGTCSVIMNSSHYPSWHDRWSGNNDIIITTTGNSTTYQINDVNECSYYLDMITSSSGSGNSGSSSYWSEVIREIVTISSMFTNFITTTEFYEYSYFSTICTPVWDNCDFDDCTINPVPEAPTIMLFGVGMLSLLIIKKWKNNETHC